MHLLVEKYPKIFGFIIGIAIFSTITKTITTLSEYRIPPFEIFFFPNSLVTTIILFIIIALTLLILASQISHNIMKPALYIAGVLCLLKSYSTSKQESTPPVLQLLFTFIFLGLLLYFVIGTSSKKIN